MNPMLIVALVYLAGFLTRLILPYALAYIQGNTGSFDWRKVAGVIVFSFIGFFPTFFTSTIIGDIMKELDPFLVQYGPYVYYLMVYFTAIGAGSFGRDAQKTPGAIKVYRSNR